MDTSVSLSYCFSLVIFVAFLKYWSVFRRWQRYIYRLVYVWQLIILYIIYNILLLKNTMTPRTSTNTSAELLGELSQRKWIQGKAAKLLLSHDTQPADEIVRNLVWLVSGMKSGIQGGIPKSYPFPLAEIMEVWFRRINEAGWSVHIGHISEQYVPMQPVDMIVFISQSDTSRFTLSVDPKNPAGLLITLL